MSTDTTLAPCPWCGEVPDAAAAVKAWQQRAPAQSYRLLERSDRIAQDDEFLCDDAATWAKDAGGLFVGTLYVPGFLRPGRRAVKP